MNGSWILIIAFYSPGGDFMDKTTMSFEKKRDCETVRVQLSNLDSPMKVKHKGVCVTRGHWDGTKPMNGIAYD